MCGHCTHSLQNQRLWQIPDQDRERYFLGGLWALSPSPYQLPPAFQSY